MEKDKSIAEKLWPNVVAAIEPQALMKFIMEQVKQGDYVDPKEQLRQYLIPRIMLASKEEMASALAETLSVTCLDFIRDHLILKEQPHE